ncbi:hypothetical protein CRENBAI_000469 [Crenichthys baileyi]|uniref:Uncharacterized protein n=1 Tax=Crenichthys baileyi TaxID=28760 RepID=A0AAV9QQU7_9TELE
MAGPLFSGVSRFGGGLPLWGPLLVSLGISGRQEYWSGRRQDKWAPDGELGALHVTPCFFDLGGCCPCASLVTCFCMYYVFPPVPAAAFQNLVHLSFAALSHTDPILSAGLFVAKLILLHSHSNALNSKLTSNKFNRQNSFLPETTSS